MFQGGIQTNIVPSEISLSFDVRFSVDTDLVKSEEMIEEYCKEAGEGTYVTYDAKEHQVPITKIDDSNPWWNAFKHACDKM